MFAGKWIPEMGESNAMTDFELQRFPYFLCLFNNCMIPQPTHYQPNSSFISAVGNVRSHANSSVICAVVTFKKDFKYLYDFR